MPDTPQATDHAKGKVLFIADDKDTGSAIETLLAQAGYKAIVARSVSEGLGLIKRHPFDLILLDWFVGIDVCRAIRTFDSETPVFFFIDFSPGSAITDALDAGAQGCFIKPALIGELSSTISASLASRRSGSD
ncbi:MAG TPA: response regulator [Blastocatellia bacterium]|nr:response regulator [Blastocatellia bacterium]